MVLNLKKTRFTLVCLFKINQSVEHTIPNLVLKIPKFPLKDCYVCKISEIWNFKRCYLFCSVTKGFQFRLNHHCVSLVIKRGRLSSLFIELIEFSIIVINRKKCAADYGNPYKVLYIIDIY